MEGIKIVDMDGGNSHSGAVNTEGDLYMWGLNNYGQLGLGDLKPRWKPTLVSKDIVGYYLHKVV